MKICITSQTRIMINHLAIWVNDLEISREFYEKYFGMEANQKYENMAKGFSSYFLKFPVKNGARLELMQRADIPSNGGSKRGMILGLAHIAISVGSQSAVDSLTERVRQDGYNIIGEPRWTGDGYYESIIEDNEGNWIEIAI